MMITILKLPTTHAPQSMAAHVLAASTIPPQQVLFAQNHILSPTIQPVATQPHVTLVIMLLLSSHIKQFHTVAPTHQLPGITHVATTTHTRATTSYTNNLYIKKELVQKSQFFFIALLLFITEITNI